MDSVAENKKSRESFDASTLAEMEEAWQNGMKSTKEKEKITALALKTNLPAEKIEVWIGNRRAKDRRGGLAAGYTKKKAAVRGPSSYTLFSQQFKRESSSKEEHFKSVAKKWGELTNEERQKYQAEAQDIRNSQMKGMTEEEATSHHFTQIQNSIGVLGSLGFEVMLLAMKENQIPQLAGTEKGLEYIEQRHVLEPFTKAMFGNIVYIKDEYRKKEKGDLRHQVRQILNSCWEKATGESKPIPYSSLLNGKIPWVLEGLPVPVKEPSNYGIGDLNKIINSNPADIKFVKKTEESPAAVLTSSSLTSTSTSLSTSSPKTAESPAAILTSSSLTSTSLSTSSPKTAASSSTATLSTSSASNILQQIITNTSILEPVHDLTEGTEETTESTDEPTGPSIPSDLVYDMSTLLGVKQDEDSAIVSIGKLEKKSPIKRKLTVTDDAERKKASTTKKRNSSKGKKGSTKYEIEFLTDDRETQGGQEFLVKWKGYPASQQSWEPVSALPMAALSLYWQKKFNKD